MKEWGERDRGGGKASKGPLRSEVPLYATEAQFYRDLLRIKKYLLELSIQRMRVRHLSISFPLVGGLPLRG